MSANPRIHFFQRGKGRELGDPRFDEGDFAGMDPFPRRRPSRPELSARFFIVLFGFVQAKDSLSVSLLHESWCRESGEDRSRDQLKLKG